MNSSAATSTMSGTPSSGGVSPLASRALIVGVIGLAIGLAGMLFGGSADDPARPFLGYLFGFAFWFSMSIGMLMLVILFYLFDAGWSVVIRRQLEHALAAIPIIALCFIPLLLTALGVFGHDAQGAMWRWLVPTQPMVGHPGEPIAADPLFIHKSGYLSLPFFILRLAIYLTVFWSLSRIFRKHSFAMDTAPDASHVRSCRFHAGWGVYFVPLCLTFAAFDFFMTLSYQWFSTMYGVWFFATSMRAGLCGTVIMCFLLSKEGGPLHGLYSRAHQYLLGCLCLTFTIFWAYITFSQYFLIYNADIPEETFWFTMRELNANWTHNSWWWVSLGLIFGYFFIPFFALLSYHNKVNRRVLPLICCWILLFHILDLYFNIMPGLLSDPNNTVLHYRVREFVPQIWDLATWVGVGGLCVWAFLRSQPKAEVIPIHDPRIVESLNYHE